MSKPQAKNEPSEAATVNEAMKVSTHKPFADDDLGINFTEDYTEPDIDAWHDPELATEFIGQVIGHKVIESVHGESDVVIVKLLKAIKAKNNKGDPIDVLAGSTIGVYCRAKLLPLLEHVEHKNTVKVVATEKVAIGHGKTMWKFTITGAKGSKRGAPPVNSLAERTRGLSKDAF